MTVFRVLTLALNLLAWFMLYRMIQPILGGI